MYQISIAVVFCISAQTECSTYVQYLSYFGRAMLHAIVCILPSKTKKLLQCIKKTKEHLKKFWTQSGIIVWAEYVGNSFHNISCFIVINREKNYSKMVQIIISKNDESMQSGQWMVWSGHLLASWSSFFEFIVWISMRYV